MSIIKTKLSISYTIILLILSTSSTVTSVIVLSNTLGEYYKSISAFSLSFSNLIVVNTLISFFSGVMTLFSLIRAIIAEIRKLLSREDRTYQLV